MKTTMPTALRALFLTREERLEELQQELERVQDEIVRLCAEKESQDAAIH